MTESELKELQSKARAAIFMFLLSKEKVEAKSCKTCHTDRQSEACSQCGAKRGRDFTDAANPEVILALITEIRALRGMCERSKVFVRHCSETEPSRFQEAVHWLASYAAGPTEEVKK